MTQSKAKKKRMHVKRTKGNDVEKNRQFSPFSTHERLTKTKKESIDQNYTKHRKPNHSEDY
ncbi:hypothetical protein ACIQ57_21135 [Lysinibacillus xylanilyticus]|uniref:hypothetical protein n=1 Tax=Lysinibacillus xylanilyticus TaxID=582475 RepID=UPI0038027A41